MILSSSTSSLFKPKLPLPLPLFLFIISAATSSVSAAVHHQPPLISTCNHVKTTTTDSKGYINYTQLYYCNFHQFPKLGFTLLLLWLVILFYTLSNTASEYFCPAVEHLSKSLSLSPAIAGTTLLPLGNGCTDVFSSVIAFTASTDGGDIGVNSVLGGSIFITTVVVGVLSLAVSFPRRRKTVVIDKPNFIRDTVFLLVTLINLLIIIIIGKINLLGSLLFVSSYLIYILLVSYMHFKFNFNAILDHLDPVKLPLLVSTDEENVVHPAEKDVHWEEQEQVLPFNQERWMKLVFYVIKLPVYLPRRLTIPLITQERWSKPILVISMVLAPIMLGVIWDTKGGNLGFKARLVTYLVVGLIGIALGSCTFAFTSSTMPPQKCLVFWYGSGFVMSVVWTYVTCNELVSLLESLGKIIGLSPSILGLTVLAWGNSIGDLTGNVALAVYGGPDGAQIAMSGCYAGPLFNVLVGLGFSFVSVSWSNYPASYVIPEDPNVCETVGFLMIGLLWALVILPKRNMEVDQTLGGGLLVVYLCFLYIKIARGVELLGFASSSFSLLNRL